MNIKMLENFVYKFREALEIVVDNMLYGRLTIFRNFPNGCCRYTSDLLAEYLMNQGISMERIQMIESETKDGEYTHCWLMIDNSYYVDVTADQFNGKTYFMKYTPIPRCYVAPCGNKYLYKCFYNSKMRSTANLGINSYSSDIPEKLQVVYDAVIKQIEINS